MTEQTGAQQPPDWYRNPPEWLREPPARRGRYREDDDDDRDNYRSRGSRYRDYDTMRDLEQKIAGMPEAVVNALKEAIQGATQQRQSNEQQQKPPEQQQNSGGQQQNSDKSGDDKPGEQLTWGEKFLMNKL